ncbi:class I SAM-dependent methyltransferase [Rhodanobacter sp. C05]|uniref:class I SAM-dependent methyltransferase n=1 Tax=Rhodanobacter sp. C05 TaxID=1945855 RepID=UPI000984AC19|nr:class I SAM-dependent methyltransferase [Rhodanobacter sp. C05]OOG37410.1 hypothetical protein B0E51_16275 [Rhodanobacter sp. C05]
MNRFWPRYISPLFELVQPQRIMEIGAEFGWNTRHILAYCRAHGAHADIIDPAPLPSLMHELAQFGPAEYRFLPLKSLAAIPQLEAPDLVLLDGDHNWATVFHELNLLQARAEKAGQAPPIVLSHDVAWPYARRDMYYNPDDLDGWQKHSYSYKGMLQGQSELDEKGVNGWLANAMHEGGPRNGVLTAIEDYIASAGIEFTFRKLPFFNGLGILVPTARMTPALQALIDSFFGADSLLAACEALEADGMELRGMLSQTEIGLTRRTEALQRAREIIEAQRQRIAELEHVQRTPANGG